MAIGLRYRPNVYISYWEAAQNWDIAAEASRELLMNHIRNTLQLPECKLDLQVQPVSSEYFIVLWLTIDDNVTDTMKLLLWINGALEIK